MAETRSRPLHLNVTPSMYDEIKQRADKEGASVNAHIENILRGAYDSSPKDIEFKDDAHREFFQAYGADLPNGPRKAIVYILGIYEEFRRRADEPDSPPICARPESLVLKPEDRRFLGESVKLTRPN
jgi:hypothetical protein